jgi:hypothetical protein
MALCAVAVAWIVFPVNDLNAGYRHSWNCCAAASCQPVCSNTGCAASNDPNGLKIHIVGLKHDTIEAFFKTDFYYRDILPGALNLHCGVNVALAPENVNGTFAVRFGPQLDSFHVYGWKADQEQPVQYSATLQAGYPVYMKWITPHILKVQYGPNYSKEFVIRFMDSDQPWKILYSSP